MLVDYKPKKLYCGHNVISVVKRGMPYVFNRRGKFLHKVKTASINKSFRGGEFYSVKYKCNNSSNSNDFIFTDSTKGYRLCKSCFDPLKGE